VDWDAQKAVWDGVFSTDVLGASYIMIKSTIGSSSIWQIDTTESSLLITEPYFNLPNLQDVYDQFVFEEYEFQSYHRCTR
jgi:actin-related protein 6